MKSLGKGPRIFSALLAAVALGIPLAAVGQVAHADGTNGEVRGFLWPGGNGIPNWEGTYRMPDGSEAWCASIWQPEPIHANDYGQEKTLTMNDGAPMSADRMEKLAYIISEASDKVIGERGRDADTYAAATAVIVHDWTNNNQSYDPQWPLGNFDAGIDPGGTGQQPQDVRRVYNLLIHNASLYAGEWELNLDEVTDQHFVGDTVTITGRLSTVNGTAIPAHEVHVSIDGATPAENIVITDDAGRISFDIVVSDQAVNVEAYRVAPASTVTMREPLSWDGPDRPQNMISVSDNTVADEVTFAADIPGAPAIGTTATDAADGDKVLPHTGGVVTDVVAYSNLMPGVTYTLRGELMDKATGEGTGITAQTSFTPSEANGEVSLDFTVPTGNDGRTFVVFERLYDVDGGLVAEHTDIDDPAQTVTVEEEPPAPAIGTSATDVSDGDRTLNPDGGTIRDVVSYENLMPGVTYTLRGELMDKATGEGTGITAETSFTPSEANGSISLDFTVPAGNEGRTLVVFEWLYDIDGKLVAEHTDIDDPAQTVNVPRRDIPGVPAIGTTATDAADGDKVLPHTGGTVRDVVSYENLMPGVTYTLRGELMDKATGEGTGITAETSFTPSEANGSISLDFTVPAGFAGSNLVVFERLYDVNGELVAEHTDIDDPAQTVTVEEEPPVPAIGTTATDAADGDKVLPHTGGTVRDVVSYENLMPGVTYTLRGELMDKATGEGTGITAQTSFTPSEANGEVSLDFTVPKGNAGKTLVAFERLYDAEGELVAEHTDINDKAQTIRVEESPVPGKPLAKTGLASGAMLPLVIVVAGLIGIMAVVVARQRKV